MSKLFIPILVGTTRAQRLSIHAARFVAECLQSYPDVETVLVDPVDFTFPGDGNDPEGKDPRYTEITKQADAFFVVVPEYNHSFPGSLKRMLDSELANYNHKPVAFAGVSSGQFGGVRAIEALVLAVRESGMVVLANDVQFPKVQELFAEDGSLKDDAYIRRVKRVLDELVWLTKVLKAGQAVHPQAEK